MKRTAAVLLALLLLLSAVPLAGAAGANEMSLAMLDDESALVDVTSDRDASLVCAFYNAGGKLLAANLTSHAPGTWDGWADIPSGAAKMRCFLLDTHTKAPLCEPLEQILPGEPVATVTSGVTFFGAAAFDPRSGQDYLGYELDDTVTWYENSAPVGQITQNAARGDVVELYDTDKNGLIDLVRVYRCAAARVTGAVTSKEVEGKTLVRVPGVVNSFLPARQIVGWEDLEAGDVAVYWQHPSKAVCRMEKARRVTGKVTAIRPSVGAVTLNTGHQLQKSGISGAQAHTGPENWSNWTNYNSEFAFYLDKNGTVCWVEELGGETPASVPQMSYVLDAAWVVYPSILKPKALEALLLFPDGSTEVVYVSSVNGAQAVESDRDRIKTAFCTYTVEEDGRYALTLAGLDSGWEEPVDLSPSGSVSPSPHFMAGDNGYLADGDTVFILATDDGDGWYEFSVCQGCAALPFIPQSALRSGAVGVARVNQDAFAYVFLPIDYCIADPLTDCFFLRDDSFDNAGDGRFQAKAVNAGHGETLLTVAQEVLPDLEKYGFYLIAARQNGVITRVCPAPDSQALTGISAGLVETDERDYLCDPATVTVAVYLRRNGETGEYVYESAQTVVPDGPGVVPENLSQAKVTALADDNGLARLIFLLFYTE